MLEIELQKYQSVLASLISVNINGGYVVIKGNEVLGVWQNRKEAMLEGTKKFGRVSFLVKSIRAEENIVFLPTLFLQ